MTYIEQVEVQESGVPNKAHRIAIYAERRLEVVRLSDALQEAEGKARSIREALIEAESKLKSARTRIVEAIDAGIDGSESDEMEDLTRCVLEALATEVDR